MSCFWPMRNGPRSARPTCGAHRIGASPSALTRCAPQRCPLPTGFVPARASRTTRCPTSWRFPDAERFSSPSRRSSTASSPSGSTGPRHPWTRRRRSCCLCRPPTRRRCGSGRCSAPARRARAGSWGSRLSRGSGPSGILRPWRHRGSTWRAFPSRILPGCPSIAAAWPSSIRRRRRRAHRILHGPGWWRR